MTGFLGLVSDTPGTELAAYLDRSSIDELVGLIGPLAGSVPGLGIRSYIHHAQEAIRRKKEWSDWSRGGIPAPRTRSGSSSTRTTPSTAPRRRTSSASHMSFRSTRCGRKSRSQPQAGDPQNDLFAAEALEAEAADRRDRPAPCHRSSRSTRRLSGVDELRRLEGPAPDGFNRVEKGEFELAEEPGLDCPEFRTVIERWKSLQGLDEEEMRRRLDLETASDGKTFLDHVLDVKDIVDLGKDLINIAFERTEKGLLVRIVEKIPGIGVPSALGVPTAFVALLRIKSAFTIPYDLWMRSAEDEERADRVAETTGQVVAVRQWLRELIAETTTPDFPEGVDIDLRSGPDGTPIAHGTLFSKKSTTTS